MPTPDVNPAWLPDHQLATAMTLGHADEVACRLYDLLFDYVQAGPLGLENVCDDNVCRATVTSVAPLPPAIARLSADVLTQLRASIEHAVYAEVEAALGRKLTPDEEPRIEMPAAVTPNSFDDWLKQRKRKDLAPLCEGSELVKRMRSLQPYERMDVDQHPLRVLAEHTNLAKHRTPAVAAVQLGQVATWPLNNPDVLVEARGMPLEVGTVLATGPRDKQVELNVYPQVAIRRPHTGEWMVMGKEIGDLAKWVRTVALPMIVTGKVKAEPPLPPQIDTTRGWANERDALRAGGTTPADRRFMTRLRAHTIRRDLPGILSKIPEPPDPAVIQRWVDELPDDQVMSQFSVFFLPDGHAKIEAIRAMIRDAQEIYGRTE